MKAKSKNNNTNVLIVALIGGFILVLCSFFAIILITRGLGNNDVVVNVSGNLPYHSCPQELVELDGEVVGSTEGHIQRMTTEDYNWVQSNCVFNTTGR